MKTRKVITVFLTVVIAMSMGITPVFADDSEPASVQDTYEYDGVTYVNVGDKQFSTNQTAYYKAMLGNALNTKVDGMGDYSISDLWAQLGWYMERYNNNAERNGDILKRWNRLHEPETTDNPDKWVPLQKEITDYLFAPDNGELNYQRKQFKWGDTEFEPLWFRDTLRSAADGASMGKAVALTAAQAANEGLGHTGNTTDIRVDDMPEETGLVFYKTLGTASSYYQGDDAWDHHGDGHLCQMVVVAFSDFNVTPIIPDEKDTTPHVYATSSSDITGSSDDKKTVSDVKNTTILTATASQSISESTSSTISSSISGSSSYSESNTHKAGIKISPGWKFTTFSIKFELSYEYTHTATDTVSKGWSKGESVTDSSSKSSNISVTLPPYTAVLLSQKNTTEKIVAKYNCPVALNFKVNVYSVYADPREEYTCIHFKKLSSFGGEGNGSALEDLYERYTNYKIADTADQQSIKWKDLDKHCADAIGTASTTATFDSTDAEFTVVLDTVKTTVDSVLPIKPIKYIRPVNVDDGSTLTNQQWDFDIDMDEGDSNYTSRIRLKALNDQGVEFATFNQAQGHFIVIDENGYEDTSGSVIELVEVNGLTKYVAKGEGTAYLKYVIDDGAYQTADMAAEDPNKYITQADIERDGETAVIQVNVHHKHKLERTAAKDPTCTEDGNIAYWTCSEGDHPCGKYFSDKNGEDEIFEDEIVVKKTGHSWGEWEVTVEPTETTEGEETRACLNGCGEVQTKSVPVTTHEHKLTRHAPSKPTCTEDGNIVYWTCSEGDNPCGKYFSDKNGEDEISEDETVDPATGHNWGEWENTVEPTETTEGEATRKCLNGCGEVQTKSVPVTPHEHKLTRHAPKKPTCTKDGNIVYWTCSEGDHPCGKYFSDKNGEDEISEDETVDPATGHSWDEWKVTKAATETAEEVKTRKCSICGEEETQTVPKPTPADQKGKDGTAVGPGASAAAAQNAITSIKSDTDPKGSVFNKLKLSSTKQTKKSISLKWTKVSKASKYVIYGNKCGNSNKPKKLTTVSGNKKTFKNIKGKKLKKGTYYKFIIVALDKNNKVVSTSKIIHVATKGGKAGNHKSVTVKKSVLTKAKRLKKGKSLKLEAKAVPQSLKLKVKKHVEVRYESTNKKIATVSKKGVVKAKKKGSCYVYAYAQNGVCKKVKVTVK